MKRTQIVPYLFAAIGAVCVGKTLFKAVLHIARPIYCKLRSKHNSVIQEKSATKAEYAVVMGCGIFAEEYVRQLIKTTNVLLVSNNKEKENVIVPGLEEQSKRSGNKFVCAHIKDGFKSMVSFCKGVHIKIFVSCIEEDDYVLGTMFVNMQKNELFEISENYLNYPYLLFYLIILSMKEGGSGVYIRLAAKPYHTTNAIGNSVIDELWKQYSNKSFIMQKVRLGFDYERTVAKSLSSIGIIREITN
jgi:hypothetical protein